MPTLQHAHGIRSPPIAALIPSTKHPPVKIKEASKTRARADRDRRKETSFRRPRIRLRGGKLLVKKYARQLDETNCARRWELGVSVPGVSKTRLV